MQTRFLDMCDYENAIRGCRFSFQLWIGSRAIYVPNDNSRFLCNEKLTTLLGNHIDFILIWKHSVTPRLSRARAHTHSVLSVFTTNKEHRD